MIAGVIKCRSGKQVILNEFMRENGDVIFKLLLNLVDTDLCLYCDLF